MLHVGLKVDVESSFLTLEPADDKQYLRSLKVNESEMKV